MQSRIIFFATLALLFTASQAFSWSFRARRQAPPMNETGNGTFNATRDVKLLVRKVDEKHPYFKKMFFRVPLELNYGLPGGLISEFKNKLGQHCNTTNITRIVMNDILLMLGDDDVMDLQNGDRIEMTSANSGPPTRAETARAFAFRSRRSFKRARGGSRKDRRARRREGDVEMEAEMEAEMEMEMEMEGRKSDRRGRGRGRHDGGRRRGSRRGEEAPEGARVVPDFDGDGEMDV